MMQKEIHHIVCIDDDEDILEVVKLCLEITAGFKVTCLKGGINIANGVSIINPDFILLDVMMPGIDGEMLLKSLRSYPNLKNTPIAFMTARVRSTEVERYLTLGADAVIKKPFDAMTLSQEIKDIYRKFLSRL